MMGIAGPGFGYRTRMMAGADPGSGYGPGMMAMYGSGFGYGPGAMAGYAAPYGYGPGMMMWGNGFAPGGPARPALTDGQRRQLEQIYRSYFGKQSRLHSRLVAGMLDLGEAMAGRNPQPQALDKAYDRLAAARKALFFNNFNMRAKIDAVLATQPSAAPRANTSPPHTPAKDHN